MLSSGTAESRQSRAGGVWHEHCEILAMAAPSRPRPASRQSISLSMTGLVSEDLARLDAHAA